MNAFAWGLTKQILGREAMEHAYIAQQVLRDLLALRSPLRKLRTASSARGMDFRHDVRDWLGGFPFEYATPGAVFRHVREKNGFELSYLDAVEGHGCNELAFRRAAA
jgi:2-polyprenyl-6-hydroxyphenyl methylase/3-demethylubiquinone-9 3-methyltransferase